MGKNVYNDGTKYFAKFNVSTPYGKRSILE
jgi:hypothetical protein